MLAHKAILILPLNLARRQSFSSDTESEQATFAVAMCCDDHFFNCDDRFMSQGVHR